MNPSERVFMERTASIGYDIWMADVTMILAKIEAGDQLASNELLPIVYAELRQMAGRQISGERVDHTLQATALVHEAYLRLVDTDRIQQWDSRAHFFSAAAEAMRRILVDHARTRASLKRGGDRQRVDLEGVEPAFEEVKDVDLLALDEALKQLERDDPQRAELVKLRYFAGLSVEQAAAALNISAATAVRRWRHTRAWLAGKMAGVDGP